MNKTNQPDSTTLLVDFLRRVMIGSENSLLFGLAIAVGIASAAGVWLFRKGIDLFQLIFQEWLASDILHPILGVVAIVVSLMLVGAIVGWIMQRFIGVERHHGVAGIMESVAFSGGVLRYARMPFKALASALSLGGGASVGPEDPSVQIGANLGSLFGQRLHLSQERVRLLVAAGGGSAIAAVFRAPIAGVFFAMEVILNNEFQTNSFGVVVLASVVSSVFTQAIEPGGAEFGEIRYALGSLVEIPLYALLGLIIAPVAALFIRTVYWQHDVWHHYTEHLSRPLRTAIAGALVGIVAIFLPQIMGTGRETMTAVLSSNPAAEYTIIFLIVLGAAKLIMTAVSIGGGFVGGLFAPSLFVGTMLGGAFGRVIEGLFPGGGLSDPQAYAIAGMAAAMSGVIRAPITAIMLVFELTNDYRLILPIMMASVVCLVVVDRLAPLGVYAFGLARAGVRIKQGRDIDVLSDLTVMEAMTTPAPCIHQSRSLVDMRDALREQQVHGLCVLDDKGELVGIATLSDLQSAYESGKHEGVVADICVRDVATTYLDEALWTAVRRMGQRDVGRLPVLESATSRRPVGILRRSDVMRAYNRAITKRIEAQHSEEQLRLHTLTGAHVVDYLIRPGAPLVGKKVKEVNWPSESSVAAIRRGEKLIVPHGSTEIKLWDTLTVVTDPHEENTLERLTGQPHPAHN